jgi:hypothetical protein
MSNNTFTWVITALDCYPQDAGQTDVVFTCHYTLNGTDGNGHNGSVYGTVGVTYTAGEPFTPYAQLTQAQVVGKIRIQRRHQVELAQESFIVLGQRMFLIVEPRERPETIGFLICVADPDGKALGFAVPDLVQGESGDARLPTHAVAASQSSSIRPNLAGRPGG